MPFRKWYFPLPQKNWRNPALRMSRRLCREPGSVFSLQQLTSAVDHHLICYKEHCQISGLYLELYSQVPCVWEHVIPRKSQLYFFFLSALLNFVSAEKILKTWTVKAIKGRTKSSVLMNLCFLISSSKQSLELRTCFMVSWCYSDQWVLWVFS